MGDAYVASFQQSDCGSAYKPISWFVWLWAWSMGGHEVSNDPFDGWVFATHELAESCKSKINEMRPEIGCCLSTIDNVLHFAGC